MRIMTDTILELLSVHGIDANVKWPNDIYVAGRKICGILIEHAVRGTSLVHSIIGVGLNVNQTMFDESLPDPTSMLLETDSGELDPDLLLEELMDIFHKNIDNITYNR
jgi:BirA family biotin operon repressor/biotin-[acetyl-CoA-carboxylase] ligase